MRESYETINHRETTNPRETVNHRETTDSRKTTNHREAINPRETTNSYEAPNPHESITPDEELANRPTIDEQSPLWLSDKLSHIADAATHLSNELEAQGREVSFETCLSVASEQVASEFSQRIQSMTLTSPEFSKNLWNGYYHVTRYLREQRRNRNSHLMN